MSPRETKLTEFLKPDVVSRLANMDLRARLIVEGFIAGLHRSPYHGFSVEFAEYRQYNAGESASPDQIGRLIGRSSTVKILALTFTMIYTAPSSEIPGDCLWVLKLECDRP